jgi:hypothetical protein
VWGKGVKVGQGINSVGLVKCDIGRVYMCSSARSDAIYCWWWFNILLLLVDCNLKVC